MAASGKNLTAAEKATRFDFIIDQLGQVRPNELQQRVQVKFGLAPSTAKLWIVRARKLVQEYWHEDRETQISHVVNALMYAMHDMDAAASTRVSATKLYCSVFGLFAPIVFRQDAPEDAMADAMKDPKIRKLQIELMAAIAAKKSHDK